MSRVACKKFTVSRDSMVSRLAARMARWKKLPTDRGKLSDKESGFESSPNSPRAESALEQAQQHAPGSQELALRGAQEERISLDSFEFIKKLGSGGYGSVVLVQKKGGRDHKAHYALKMTSLNRAALVERDILPRLENVPYTLDLAYAFFDPRLNKAYLVLPFAVGKDLFALAGPCTSPKKKPGYLRRMFHYNYIKYLYRVRIILAELCVAISHLHKLNIVYRDLKLENILVFGDGHIRLADFGLSKLFEEGESTQISGKTGTPDYMAPEVLQSSGNFTTTTTYSFEADLWGLGVIAYELIVGQLPFRGQETADLETSILEGLVEIPRSFLDDKYIRLARKERPLVLAALSFVKALLQLDPRDRLSNDLIPKHIFFQDLDFAQIATGDHDDPPFDIRRIDAEREEDREIEQIPAAFVGMPSYSNKNRPPDKNGFDNPAKFANYHFVRRTSGWYFSDLEGSQCEDSRLDLPDNVGYKEEAELDTSVAAAASEQNAVAIHAVPGLIEYEAILAEEQSIDSDDMALVMPGHGTPEAGTANRQQNGDVQPDETVLQEPQLTNYEEDEEEDDEDVISSSPSSLDSAIDEVPESVEPAAVPPMAASTPVRHEIEMFPRVRLVPDYYTSPPSYSPAPVAPRTMPKLLPVSSVKRRLNLGMDLSAEGSVQLPAAPPSTPTTPGEPAPRGRRLDLELELDAALVAPGRPLTRRLLEIVRDVAASPTSSSSQQPASDLSWASMSSVHQSWTPSQFERDSPMSPSPEKIPLQDDSPMMPPRAEHHAWEPFSPVHQACSPGLFERDSPLSPSPEKARSTARQIAHRRDSPTPSTSTQAWTPLSPMDQSYAASRFERDSPLSPGMPAPSAFEEVQLPNVSEPASGPEPPPQPSTCSPQLDMTLTRSARARAFMEQSALSDAAMTAPGDKSSSSAGPSKRSPAPGEPSSSRPRRRRAAVAFAAVPSPNLPPKKRRRFRSPAPSPSPMRSLSQLGSDGPRVIVETTSQPLTQSFYSLRSGAVRAPGRR